MKTFMGIGVSDGRPRARAAAIVEFAVVSPLLLAILFGIIEYGYVFMVRQTLTNAAREGCRIAVLQTTVSPYSEVTNRVDGIMSTTGLTGYTTTMAHWTTGDPTESVTVSIPFAEVSLMGNFFGQRTGNLVGTCSMHKEGVAGASSG